MSTVGFVQPTNFSGQDTREKWLEHSQLAIADDDPVASRLGKEVIGSSASFHWAMKQAETVAPTRSALLIQGETGSGGVLTHLHADQIPAPPLRSFIGRTAASLWQRSDRNGLDGYPDSHRIRTDRCFGAGDCQRPKREPALDAEADADGVS